MTAALYRVGCLENVARFAARVRGATPAPLPPYQRLSLLDGRAWSYEIPSPSWGEAEAYVNSKYNVSGRKNVSFEVPRDALQIRSHLDEVWTTCDALNQSLKTCAQKEAIATVSLIASGIGALAGVLTMFRKADVGRWLIGISGVWGLGSFFLLDAIKRGHREEVPWRGELGIAERAIAAAREALAQQGQYLSQLEAAAEARKK